MSTPASAMIQPTIVRSTLADHVRHRERKDQSQRDEEDTESVTHASLPFDLSPAGGTISAERNRSAVRSRAGGGVGTSPRRSGRMQDVEKRIGVCNLCEAICGLEITIDDGRVTGVRGNPDDPLSRGHICPKGVAIGDIHADPDRLRRPVRRDGDRPGPRSAGTRRSTWSPTGCRGRSATARTGRARDLPRQPQRAQPGLDDPRQRDGEVAAAPATGSAPPRSTSSPTSWSRT